MNRVVDIRGPNGSGKTWVVRQLIAAATKVTELRGPVFCDPEDTKPTDVWGIRLDGLLADGSPVYAVGPYDELPTGGCDRIYRQETVTDRVRYLARHGSVVFEGVITGMTFGRYGELARELKAAGAWYGVLVLDTPMSVCIERVKARRAARGTEEEGFNVALMEENAHRIEAIVLKFADQGTEVRWGGLPELKAMLQPEQGVLGL